MDVMGCFHILSFMNGSVYSNFMNGSVYSNFHVTVSLILLNISLGVELLEYTLTLSLTCWKTTRRISRQLLNFTFLPAMYRCCGFSASSPVHIFVFLKNFAMSSGFEVAPHCDFDLHFSPWQEYRRVPWTEEPSGLQPVGSQRVGDCWSDWACTHKKS